MLSAVGSKATRTLIDGWYVGHSQSSCLMSQRIRFLRQESGVQVSITHRSGRVSTDNGVFTTELGVLWLGSESDRHK
jgi:hypothetical protein